MWIMLYTTFVLPRPTEIAEMGRPFGVELQLELCVGGDWVWAVVPLQCAPLHARPSLWSNPGERDQGKACPIRGEEERRRLRVAD